jgi:hypothetical protein
MTGVIRPDEFRQQGLNSPELSAAGMKKAEAVEALHENHLK